MIKRICVATATRAEYGLLKPLIQKLRLSIDMDVKVVVTGAHLSPEFGLTYGEIERDGIQVDKKIEILLSSDTPSAVSKSMGLALISFGEYFEEVKPDLLIILGDRYEALAICCAAMNSRIPIAHLHGGETTEGAVDEGIRHAITKLSYLHFASTDEYRKRVIQMGENPQRVFNVGAMGVENACHVPLMSKEDLQIYIKYELKNPYAVVTFHPVTLEDGTSKAQVQELLQALDAYDDMQFIITKANADTDGRIINQMLDSYAQTHKNTVLIDSLGVTGYLSAVKYAEMVIGNSSSGLIEVPSFKIPTVNIGDRQRGRIQPGSVVNCAPVCEDIVEAIAVARSQEFRRQAAALLNPYGDGETSDRIINIIRDYLNGNKVELKKKFYDIGFCITD